MADHKPIEAPRPPPQPKRGAVGGRGKQRGDKRKKQQAAVPVK